MNTYEEYLKNSSGSTLKMEDALSIYTEMMESISRSSCEDKTELWHMYLEQALQRGHWLKSDKEIKTIGASREECRCTTFKIVQDPAQTLSNMLPKWFDLIAKKYFIKTPHFNFKKCRMCGRCEQICPPHIIDLEGPNGTARVSDKTKCIHCFCCHEICSFGAIKLRRF